MNFQELKKFYSENFSLGYISNTTRSSFENRIVLISLICYITYKAKLKNPDTTYYEIIMKLSKNLGLPDEFIEHAHQEELLEKYGLNANGIFKQVLEIVKR